MIYANTAAASSNNQSEDNVVIENVASVTTVAVQPAANTPIAAAPSVQYSEGFRKRLTNLENDAKHWEASAYTTANDGLYQLLQQCYQLYKDLTNVADIHLIYKKQGLADHLAMNGLAKYADKPLSQKIIRCVFGDRDRRRISTYNVALRVIIEGNWKVEEVPTKIAERGGVQEMTLGRKPGGLTAKDKAVAIAAEVQSTVMASVKTAATDQLVKADKVGDKYAAVLTQEVDGTFSIHCIVESTSAVNAALTAFYNARHAAEKGANES